MIFNSKFPIISFEDFKIITFDNVLKLLLFLSTLVFIPGVNLIILDQKFFCISAICLFLASLNSVYKVRVLNWNLLICFNFVFLINCFLHGLNSCVLIYTLNIFLFSLIIYLVVSYCENFRNCFKWIIISFAINFIILTVQWSGHDFIMPATGIFSGALMGNVARLSFLACIILPLTLGMKFGVIWAPLCVLSCGVYHPQYCIYATILIIIFAKFYSNKAVRDWMFEITYLLVITGMLFTVWIFKSDSITVRLEYYIPVIHDLITKHLLTGFGAGIKFSELCVANKDMQIYSSVLQFFFTTGICGIIWFVFAVRKFFKYFRSTPLNLSILTFLIISIWEYPFQVMRLWFVLASLISFLIIENYERRKA